MSKQYRYPGAKPFETTEENIFFGRDEDIKKMLRLIELEQSLVLYGKSGLGKSSLINAGLVPRIEEKGRYQSIKIRFGAYTPDKQDMPLAIARESISSSETWLQQIKGNDDNSLWYHLKNHQIKDKTQGYLLIFDQFEELFTYPENYVADFAKQLSEIIYTLIPNRFREEFEANKENLTKEQMEALHTPLDLKVLIAIRSDRMSLMNRLKPYLPDVLMETYEIKPLTEIQAEDAILNPAYKKGDFLSPIFDYEDKTLSQILDFLTQQRTQNVESFQLQILCQHVEQLVIDKEIQEITLEDIGDIAAVYENYYLNQIARLGDDATQLAARKLVEEGLIFEEEERRLSLYDVQILKHYGVDGDLLRKLVDTHLLRAEPSLRGGYTYELSHDTLVAPVLRAKALRVQVEKQEQAIAEKERLETEKLALQQEADAERQRAEQERELKDKAIAAKEDANSKRKRVNILLISSILLLGIATISFFHLKKSLENLNKKTKELEIEQQQNKRIINAFYFHGDSLALAYKNRKFGFINKKGEVLIDYKYNKAENFDDKGLAKVVKNDKNYLIDTEENEYTVAYKAEDLSEDVLAFDTRGTKLDYFPNEVFDYPQLEVLILDGKRNDKNIIAKIPREIEKLKQLKILSLNWTKIKKLPIEELKNLTILDLSYSEEIEELPIEKLENLTELYLQKSKIKKLPIEGLKNLAILDLSYTEEIEELHLGQLKNLAEAYLINTKIKTLDFGQLKKLTKLNLSFSFEIKELPQNITELVGLETLDLSGTGIKELPKDIGQLKKLTKLDLSFSSEIKELPQDIIELAELTTLDLSGTGIKKLPKDIGQLKKLTYLNLINTEITELPKSIRQLENLRELNLAGSTKITEIKITDLPKNLKYLNLSRISAMEENIKRLKKQLPNCEIIH